MYKYFLESMDENRDIFMGKSFTSALQNHILNEYKNDNIYEEYNLDELNTFNAIPSFYLINKPELETKNTINDSRSTWTKTNQIKEEYNEPELYTSEKIKSIFNKESNKDKFSENMKKLDISKYIEDNFQFIKIKKKE